MKKTSIENDNRFNEIKDVKFLSSLGFSFENVKDSSTFIEAFYSCEKLVIPTKEAYYAFMSLIEDFLCYDDCVSREKFYIKSEGTWYKVFNRNSDYYILSEEEFKYLIKNQNRLLSL